MQGPIQPILVMPVYRGGERFERALGSLASTEHHFQRVVVSLNGPDGSTDVTALTDYRERAMKSGNPSKAEPIISGTELPWIPHQWFWLEYLERTGARPDDWILWFAHDDELRATGIERLVDTDGNWPLEPGSVYLGPWAMRGDEPDRLYDGPRDIPLESWTSFPVNGPHELPVTEWIAQQLEQPTYINMSGCIAQLRAFQQLRDFPIAKPGGMRIEMAIAAAPVHATVREFPEPVMITYGCAASDRTKYAKVARRDDRHLVAWLANYVARRPAGLGSIARAAGKVAHHHFSARRGRNLPEEDWRFRELVDP